MFTFPWSRKAVNESVPDSRYEYRIVRYPKKEKSSGPDKLYEEALQKLRDGKIDYKTCMVYAPVISDADWRWTSEYRVDSNSDWVEMSVHDSETMAEYTCTSHAKKRAAPKVTYLGKLP